VITLVGTLVVAMVAAVLLRLSLGLLSRQLPPPTFVGLVAVAAVAIAGAGGLALSDLAFAVLGRHQFVATAGGWSPTVWQHVLPVPQPVGWLAMIIVLVLFVAALVRAVRCVVALVSAELADRRLGERHGAGEGRVLGRRAGPGYDRVLVVPDDEPDAYTVAGLRGRVIVTTGMLRCLPDDERQVLFAHELSHLRHRHHAYVQCVEIAAAANPVLRPVVEAVRHAVERWADEDAATAVGDRSTVARAIARAGLARHRSATPAVALGVRGGRVADRALALLAPPPPRGRLVAACLCVFVLAVGVVSVNSVFSLHGAVEYAQARLPHLHH
jgi:hypothetical protein